MIEKIRQGGFIVVIIALIVLFAYAFGNSMRVERKVIRGNTIESVASQIEEASREGYIVKNSIPFNNQKLGGTIVIMERYGSWKNR
jgi:hypothetical protein